MPLDDSQIQLLAASVGINLSEGDGRLANMKVNYYTNTDDVVRENAASALRVNQIISTLDAGRPVVQGVFSQSRFSAAKWVLDYVNGARVDPVAAKARIDFAEFVIVTLELPRAAVVDPAPAGAREVLAEWDNLSQARKGHVKAYVNSRALVSVRVQNLCDVCNALGAAVPLNLQRLGEISAAVSAVRPNDPRRFEGINKITMPNIRTLFGLHPPNSVFNGFAAWGPGDHGTVDANIRWHFLKHVCGMTDKGEQWEVEPVFLEAFRDAPAVSALLTPVIEAAEPDLREPEYWWRRLTIQLTRTQFEANVSKYERLDDTRNWFTGLNNSLSYRHVREFLERGTLLNNPSVLGHLVTTYENAYRDDAINASKSFTECLVQSNGEKNFVSGCDERDDIFIIGRLHGGVLGISSAYIAFDLKKKMDGARSNMIWRLK